MSATAPTSSRPSMNRTGRPTSADSFSLRIITAPPKLMISQAIKKPAPSRIPKTPSAPIRLMAAPNNQPAWPSRRRRQRAGERRRNEAEAEEPGAVGAQLKENRRAGEVRRQPCRGRAAGQRQDGRANSGEAAKAQQDASNGAPRRR